MLGNGRLEGHCFDGQTRLCHIRGKMRKKVWVNQGDIILIGLRDYQDAKADVILKYTSDEARRLKSQGELPDSVRQTKRRVGGCGMGRTARCFSCVQSCSRSAAARFSCPSSPPFSPSSLEDSNQRRRQDR